MTITLNINGKPITLEHYFGWSEPGRIPQIDFKEKSDNTPLPIQLLEISGFLTSTAKNGRVFTSEALEDATGYSPSAWRQVRPLMYKLGFLTTQISQNRKIDSDDPISAKGKTYNLITEKRLANQENYESLREIQQMLWSRILMHYQTENPSGLYPVRAVLRTLSRNEYLNKLEWDLMTTFITDNDNEQQELIVDIFIKEYREKPESFLHIKRVPSSKKGPKGDRQSNQINRNTYWRNLIEGKLVKLEDKYINGKKVQVITLNRKSNELIEEILSNDFYQK